MPTCERYGCRKKAVRKFCSAECRTQHHSAARPPVEKETRNCQRCEKPFTAKKGAKYCSQQCRLSDVGRKRLKVRYKPGNDGYMYFFQPDGKIFRSPDPNQNPELSRTQPTEWISPEDVPEGLAPKRKVHSVEALAAMDSKLTDAQNRHRAAYEAMPEELREQMMQTRAPTREEWLAKVAEKDDQLDLFA